MLVSGDVWKEMWTCLAYTIFQLVLRCPSDLMLCVSMHVQYDPLRSAGSGLGAGPAPINQALPGAPGSGSSSMWGPLGGMQVPPPEQQQQQQQTLAQQQHAQVQRQIEDQRRAQAQAAQAQSAWQAAQVCIPLNIRHGNVQVWYAMQLPTSSSFVMMSMC